MNKLAHYNFHSLHFAQVPNCNFRVVRTLYFILHEDVMKMRPQALEQPRTVDTAMCAKCVIYLQFAYITRDFIEVYHRNSHINHRIHVVIICAVAAIKC